MTGAAGTKATAGEATSIFSTVGAGVVRLGYTSCCSIKNISRHALGAPCTGSVLAGATDTIGRTSYTLSIGVARYVPNAAIEAQRTDEGRSIDSSHFLLDAGQTVGWTWQAYT